MSYQSFCQDTWIGRKLIFLKQVEVSEKLLDERVTKIKTLENNKMVWNLFRNVTYMVWFFIFNEEYLPYLCIYNGKYINVSFFFGAKCVIFLPMN